MTAKECFEHALSFVPETAEENAELNKFIVPWCNTLLAETFLYENLYRKATGAEELSSVPKVKKAEEEIPYNEKLVLMAFPYGMARWIFRGNDDLTGNFEYYQLYVNAIKEATPIFLSEVEDVY